MKRKIISLLVCALILSLVTPTAIAANEISEEIAVNINSMMCSEIDVVNIENYEPMSSTRATARVEVEVNPNSIMRGNTALSLEADELVTINCTYSPRTADVDFGLITPQNTFRYLSGEDGIIAFSQYGTEPDALEVMTDFSNALIKFVKIRE